VTRKIAQAWYSEALIIIQMSYSGHKTKISLGPVYLYLFWTWYYAKYYNCPLFFESIPYD